MSESQDLQEQNLQEIIREKRKSSHERANKLHSPYRNIIEPLKNTVGELKKEATHDSLTGLLNRRGFKEATMGHIDHARRTGEPLSFGFLDMDQFKPINDILGHEKGDEILKVLADSMISKERPSDSPARPQGDEFWLQLVNCKLEDAINVSERIRKNFEEKIKIIIPSQYHNAIPTVSIGISELGERVVEKEIIDEKSGETVIKKIIEKVNISDMVKTKDGKDEYVYSNEDLMKWAIASAELRMYEEKGSKGEARNLK